MSVNVKYYLINNVILIYITFKPDQKYIYDQ